MQDARGPTGHLRSYFDALAPRFLGNAIHLVVDVGRRGGRDQRDGSTGFPRERLYPCPLVIITEMIRDELENAVLQPLHRKSEGEHLIAAGKGAGHVHTVLILVQQRA